MAWCNSRLQYSTCSAAQHRRLIRYHLTGEGAPLSVSLAVTHKNTDPGQQRVGLWVPAHLENHLPLLRCRVAA